MLLDIGTKILFDSYKRSSHFLWAFNSQAFGPTKDAGAENILRGDLRVQLPIYDLRILHLKAS